MISDLEVHQFLEALDVANPEASKFGLLASSTPFVTGKPVTMFYDGDVVQDGVLGVSLVVEKDQKKRPPTTATTTTVEYPTLAPLGPAMQVTRCRGNIILELDESNATRLLLDRLQATTLTKDKEYFLATGEPVQENNQDVNVDMSQATVYKITGGDPSKGNMAVDTVHDLNVGQWVQFLHHDRNLSHGHFDESLLNNSNQLNHESLRFTATDPNNTLDGVMGEEQLQQSSGRVDAEKEGREVLQCFGGSSENGFIAGQPGEQTWVCSITDSALKHIF
ncbi:hypothetical protein BGX34_008357 [Mortierella sp. NVP85]|nr:hypothetical protein BGX34_008357 [Mortierella sp. NVP85]